MADLAENARRKVQGKKPVVISPLALEAVRRIDALFEIERSINGETHERRPEAERAVGGIALGRKSWLFCGSDRGGDRAAVMYSS
jgi:hypothetical protein